MALSLSLSLLCYFLLLHQKKPQPDPAGMTICLLQLAVTLSQCAHTGAREPRSAVGEASGAGAGHRGLQSDFLHLPPRD